MRSHSDLTRRLPIAAMAVLVLVVALLPASASAERGNDAPEGSAGRAALTNLDHLDWLGDSVSPADHAGHSTYRLADEPSVGVLWTYADRQSDGSYRRVGGGNYDAATNTYGQGAFNADDVARAAVVYLRHWVATGAPASREHAYQLLRGLTYLQTVSGDNAGNVVLWMQPDGTLNPSAEPVELPDPSDSDASYWLARTIWALGEGYAAFRDEDPAFAAFLRQRLDLAVDAVDRQVLDRYGSYLDIDGQRTPAWLISDGADATAEAVLGLSAYAAAGGPASARQALGRLSTGIAQLSGGNARTWPFGAVRPWALSRSVWHAWASQMPAGLATASTALSRPRLARVAARDSFTFDPWLLTSGGADNGRLPTRGDTTQIAYGTDSRLQSLIATGEAIGRMSAARRLAAIVAAWYFGANAAGEPMYDPATGRTYDGVSGDGTINQNSGAESTIHGLLSMLALDAHRRIAARARMDVIERRVGTRTLDAEDANLSGGATVVTPESLWTGESLFSGTGYVALGADGRVSFDTSVQRRKANVLPVVDLRPGSTAGAVVRTRSRSLGRIDAGAVGAQGDSPAAGALLPVTLDRSLRRGDKRLMVDGSAGGDDTVRLDAVMLQPLVARLVLSGGPHATALLASASDEVERSVVRLGGDTSTRVAVYNGLGRLIATRRSHAQAVSVSLPAGGFAVVSR